MAGQIIPAAYRMRLVDHETFVRLMASRDWMAAHYDRHLTLAEAANQAYLSPFHYHRLFHRAFGETPFEFLTRHRLEKAQELLRKSPLSVTEVCFEVGYGSLGSFSSLFAKHLGAPPSEFKRVFSIPQNWALRAIPGCYLALLTPANVGT